MMPSIYTTKKSFVNFYMRILLFKIKFVELVSKYSIGLKIDQLANNSEYY